MAIYRRGEIYWCEWRIGGARTRESTGTADRAAAQEWHDRRRAELWREARLGERPPATWDEAALAWLSEHSAHKRSHADDLLILRWLTGRLSGKTLPELTTAVMVGLRDAKIAEGCAPATANRHLAVVSAVMNHHARTVPAIVPTVPYLTERTSAWRWITREQARALLAELPPHLAAMSRLALATGLRRANITGLQWSRVDLARRVAWIESDDMKAGRALAVPLNDEAVAVLRGQWGTDPAWVFTWRKEPIFHVVTKAWHAACLRAGVEGLRFHDLRHTWASWHVQAGTPLPVLQQLGGWASYSMVLRYAHLAPGHVAGYADRVSLTISPTGGDEVSECFASMPDGVGWLTGLEPATTGITIRDSTS
ncbi:MAG: site-specific integrase [Burkholderiales bacterium]|nr:site-specific integrase [Burkholderiales bacterium]